MTILKKVAISIVTITCTTKLLLIHSNNEYSDIYYSMTHVFDRFSSTPIQNKPKVVILGTGWGALSCLQKFDSNKVDVKIISPRSYFFYTPLLAGVSTGTVNSSSIMESIRWHLLKFGGTNNYIQGECISVNFHEKTLKYSCHSPPCENPPSNDDQSSPTIHELPYDHLIIAVGAQPATFNIPGVEEHAIFMKEIENGLTVHYKILEILEHANSLLLTGEKIENIENLLHWIVIGGGPTGVELTAELNDFISSDVMKYFPHLVDHIRVTLIEGTHQILGTFDPKISNYAEKTLIKNGTKVLCNSIVTQMTSNIVEIKKINSTTSQPQYEKLNYGLVVWAGGITARPITQKLAQLIGNEQIPPNGRPIRGLLVDNKFQVIGIPKNPKSGNENDDVGSCVWAIGDCTLSGYPPTAQVAYQQGNYLGRMLRDTNFQMKLIQQYPPFEMKNYGSMAYLGASQGVAELKGMLWDRYPISKESSNGKTILEGTSAFALWRSLYFSRLLSNKNKAQVIFDWLKASIFGRDISSPYIPPSSPSSTSSSPSSSPSPAVAAPESGEKNKKK